jgi:predicted RNase H-like nuclease (RuvC/YqgF family)
MATQKIQLTEAQLRSMVKQVIYESINEGDIDEGKFSNFFNSLGQGIKGTVRGGLDQGRQMYNQTMAQRSQADADAAEQQAAEFRAKQNAGYKNIPEVQAIVQKYDAKIGKLNSQVSNIQSQISELETQKRTEMRAAKRKHMSNMGKQVSKFNNQRDSYSSTANQANTKANDLMNRRRASLGLDPVQAAGKNPDTKTPPRMNVGQGA